MRSGEWKWARLGFVTLYALATLMAALMVSAHAAHHDHHRVSTVLCNSDDRDHGETQKSAESCCDACLLTDIGGAPPGASGSFLFRHEIGTRLNFALRLGQTADGTPDNLRSRAPPAPSV